MKFFILLVLGFSESSASKLSIDQVPDWALPVPEGLPACAPGYNRTKKSKWACTDINECSNLPWNNCTVANPCVNTPGSYFCKCPTGYNGSWPTCTDIDECTQKNAFGKLNHTCTLNAKFGQVCNNTVGSFVCRCAAGWAPTYAPNFTHLNCSNVNECIGRTHNCHVKGNCTDTVGSFTCTCNAGYLGDGVSCAEVDECVLGLHSCHEEAECRDTSGSFECTCKVGFAGNGTNCTEINECNQTLSPNVTWGLNNSYDDFRGVRAGVHNCDANLSTCTNTWGSYLCSCNAGYVGTGKVCEDINECTEMYDNCTQYSTCNNTVGSYTCACNTGYKMANGTDGINGTCIDINECYVNALARGGGTTTTTTGDGVRPPYKYGRFAVSVPNSLLSSSQTLESDYELSYESIPNALCHQRADCMNTFGSYKCLCHRGWYGDGGSCEDMDECASGQHNCDIKAHCVNTPGSFRCECLPGYNGSGTRYTGGWPPIDGCWDFDECTNTSQAYLHWNLTNMTKLKETPWNLTNLRVCPHGADCTNNVGSFSCACGAGWEGTGATCRDIDECTLQKHRCDINAWCNNTAGSYECKCNAGYYDVGEGRVCDDEARIEVGQFKFSMIENSTWNGKRLLHKIGWQRIRFKVNFTLPPVVVIQVPYAGEREFTPRVRKVTTTGFDFQIAFANSTNGTVDGFFFLWLNKTIRTVSYMAAMPGTSKLPDGTIVVASTEDIETSMKRSTGCSNADIKGSWKKINFPTFTQRPVLLAQIIGEPVAQFIGGGVPPDSYCVAALRFNTSWNESNNTNNSAWIGRICDLRKPGDKNKVPRTIGWIAIGSNYSNATNASSFFYNNWTATMNTTVKYMSFIASTNISHGATEEPVYNQTFAKAPIVLANKISTNGHVIGRLDFLGALGDKAQLKSVEEVTCTEHRRKEEYINMFVVEKTFSI
eukprot:TRINITY_DN1194_c0_g1_i2.p1 TRINITY_DN1194_c0_g1~~TRINITY_DN1194_c0_g1_i2.p1  ORF type:complete len:938 (+),score=138.65 TRINITY_DN1194_c0_g1_i2:52-2865(+)